MVGGGKSDAMYRNRERCRKMGTDFVDKVVHASVAYDYNCDGSDSLRATVQSKSCYLKILKV